MNADLHDGEHDDVEGGVGAVEHLPLHAGAQGPHLLVNILKYHKNITKCKLFILQNILTPSYEEDPRGFEQLFHDTNTVLFEKFSQDEENFCQCSES